MINVLLKGGLGNVLFQYAVGLCLARRRRTGLRLLTRRHIDRRDPLGRRILRLLGQFDIGPVAVSSQFHHAVATRLGLKWPEKMQRIYREQATGFDPAVLDLPDGAWLDGYFQSPRYFNEIAADLRDRLRIRAGHPEAAPAGLANRLLNENSVAVHIRRGDYLHSPMHNVCGTAYYAGAVARLRGRLDSPRFYVFSDDPDWCRAHLPAPDCIVVENRAAHASPVVDLNLMRLCHHQIISNSTFSWWAAWLNNHPGRIVVAPERWFNDAAADEMARRELLADDWLRVPV